MGLSLLSVDNVVGGEERPVHVEGGVGGLVVQGHHGQRGGPHQKIVVDAHNALRRKVATGGEELGVGGGQPGAANMKEIRWSKELAKIAQRWTDQCTFGHDKKRNKKDGTYVGQNAFIRGGSRQQSKDEVTASLENGVKAWYNEVKDWDSSKINPFQ